MGCEWVSKREREDKEKRNELCRCGKEQSETKIKQENEDKMPVLL